MRSFAQLSASDTNKKTYEETEVHIDNNTQESAIASDVDASKGELQSDEKREHGMSSVEVWLLWFWYAGGFFFIIFQIIFMTCDRGSYVLIDWWLAIWTSAAGKEVSVFGVTFPNQYDGVSAQIPYLLVYVVLMVFMFLFLAARTQWAIHGGIKASRRVFSNMTRRVLHCPMSFFDTTPLGRIINRFTYDVEQVDIALSQNMAVLIICISWGVAGQVVMISIVPYMAIVNVLVFSFYFIILRYYRGAGADLQRLDAVSRSPIVASLSESLDGTATIRAFDKNDHFARLFQSFINDNSSAMLNFVASRRWLAVRLDLLGACVTLCVSLCITVFSDQLGLSPGMSGFFFIWGSSKYCSLFILQLSWQVAKHISLLTTNLSFLSRSTYNHICLFL
jgi:ABC-type multidrug transport system fused ATPase/permease subunit